MATQPSDGQRRGQLHGDGQLSGLNCVLTVASNEPINGLGDGDTAPDWEVVDDHHVQLRAERSGKGNGRLYTITTTCTDASGNAVTKTSTVFVPKNQKGAWTRRIR